MANVAKVYKNQQVKNSNKNKIEKLWPQRKPLPLQQPRVKRTK